MQKSALISSIQFPEYLLQIAERPSKNEKIPI